MKTLYSAVGCVKVLMFFSAHCRDEELGMDLFLKFISCLAGLEKDEFQHVKIIMKHVRV